uniref:Si:dkeyp-23e4.3 n=1 Tax=Callorhinchus milii TaxID=7868 RepID=A0A4W3GKZ8_CALMI
MGTEQTPGSESWCRCNGPNGLLLQIEAKDACEWLRAAGFPQYAQLFEDSQFPVDIELVKNDHEFLDRDAIESLCRRLKTLNKCSAMRLEIGHERRKSDDFEDEEPCAISNKWTFQRESRRWSRLETLEVSHREDCPSIPLPDNSLRLKSIDSDENMFAELGEKQEVLSIDSSSSGGGSDSLGSLKNPESQVMDFETSRSSSRCSSIKLASPDSSFSGPPSPSEPLSFCVDNRPSEQCTKPKGKSLLNKMERLRLRGSSLKRSARPKLRPVISAPVQQEGFSEEKLRNLNCVDIREINQAVFAQNPLLCSSSQTCSSSSQSENSSTVSTPSPVLRTRSQALNGKRGGMYLEKFGTLPSSFRGVGQQSDGLEQGQHERLIFQIPQGHKPGTFPKALYHRILSPIDNTVNWRTGSFHGYRRGKFGRQSRASNVQEFDAEQGHPGLPDNRMSVYDNVPGAEAHLNNGDDEVFEELDDVMEHVNGLQRLVNKWTEKFSDEGESDSANDSTSPYPSSPKEIHLQIEKHLEERAPAHDLDNAEKSLHPALVHYERDSGVGSSLTHKLRLQIDGQSAAQLNLLQKLALLKLTALMDKYSPSSKQGWNWTVPKFIRKIKAPDYKDRVVFGLPLLLNVQRTGHPLPKSILQALHFLRSHCLDQVGLFRKSGVKSRIQALREMNESFPDSVSYEGQSAFDVADMVKQYFRDLPEPLLTTKLCESFLHIYQCLFDQRLSAVQAAILLLPDENREVLQTLLFFLGDVVASVDENQMTPTNLAVCLAPSLFHLNTLRREGTGSRMGQRKYNLGKPDQRDLSENLAATQGLAHMIAECTNLFQVPEDWARQARNSCLAQQEFQSESSGCLVSNEKYVNVKRALESSMQNLVKEAKEKFKGWVTCSNVDHVEIAYKKVDDGHPLRLWKVGVEVDVPAEEILKHLLKEHHLWEKDLLQSKTIETLDDETEIYHYAIGSTAPHPAREYVVLRTWLSDPQSRMCVLAATSVNDTEAPSLGVRGDVITSQYLIESTGLVKSRLLHICQIDTRGRTPEWYNRVFGYRCAAKLLQIRDSVAASDCKIRETKI